MSAQLLVVIEMEAFNCDLFDDPVHPLDLAVGPRVFGFCQALCDSFGIAGHAEAYVVVVLS